MFKAERREKIKALVREQRQVDVASLSKLLNVTEVTIRSDLENLEQEGFLKRLHGGAMLNEAQNDQQEADVGPAGLYNRHKHNAAKLAAGLIQENDRIFLGAGETCYYIAKELSRFKHLTVLTNNLLVANALQSSYNLQLTITGGQLVPGRNCVAGEMLHKTIADLYLNRAFFSTAGADIVAGYTVNDSYDAAVYRSISARSRDVAVVMDQNKFDTISFVKLDDLDLFPIVVCGGDIPQPYKAFYREHNISLVLPNGQELPDTE